MMLSLFIILLCISLLKLQHFTTLCKMRNAIHMQLITETDVCISLTFTCLPSSPQGMKTLKKPKPAAALYHQTAKSINFVFLFFSFFLTIIKLERKKNRLETCVSLVPLSSCNKHEKYMCTGQMAGTQNTHSKWRPVFHTTQTKPKQQTCCKQKQNNISHQHSRQGEVTGKEAGKGTRKKRVFIPPRWGARLRQTVPTSVRFTTDDKFWKTNTSSHFGQSFTWFKVMHV